MLHARPRTTRAQPIDPTARSTHVKLHVVLCLVLSMIAAKATAAASSSVPGTVTTVGTTASSPYGVLVDATTGIILYVQGHNLQRMFPNGTSETVAGTTTSGTADGVGGMARFNSPWGIAGKADSPLLVYVADRFNHCIRQVALSSWNVTTLAGVCGDPGFTNGYGSNAHFYSPAGIALYHNTTSGVDVMLFVADFENKVIRRINLIDAAYVDMFAGSGVAGSDAGPRESTAAFRNPKDVAVDGTGRWLYVVDDHCVRKVDTDVGGAVTTVAGSCDGANGLVDGVGTVARFDRPFGASINSNGTAVYIADAYNCAIRRVTIADRNVTTVSGGTCGPTSNGPTATARFGVLYRVGYYELRSVSGGAVSEVGLIVAANYYGLIRRIVLDVPDARTLSAAISQSQAVSTTASGSANGSSTSATASQRTPSTTASGSANGSSTSATGSLSPTDGSATKNLTLSAPPETVSVSPTHSTEATGSAMTHTRGTHTASLSASRSATCTPTRRSISLTGKPRSVTHEMLSTTTSRTRDNVSASETLSVVSGGVAHRMPSLSLTVSASSWACGVLDVRNVSLQTAYPQPTLPSFTDRTLAVSPVVGLATSSPATAVASNGVVVNLVASSLPRLALLALQRSDLPQLLLSLALQWTGATRWAVANVASVHPPEQLVFGTTSSDEEDAGRAITMMLRPPLSSSMGWLEEGWGVYAPAEIVLEIALACTAEGGNTTGGRTATVRVAIPAPGAPRELAEKVETTVTAVQWSTAVGGPGAGSAVGRVGAVRSMMLCGGGGDNGGPSGGGLLGIRIECDGTYRGTSSGSSVAAARGAIFGNAAILAGFMVLVALLVQAVVTAMQTTFLAACLRLSVPSVLLPVWIAVLPSTSAGAAELFSSGSTTCASDAAIAVFGLLMCAVPVCWIGFVALRLVSQLQLRVVPVPIPATDSSSRSLNAACGDGSLFRRLRSIAREVLRSRTRWEPSSSQPGGIGTSTGDGADSRYVMSASSAKVLLREYGVLWYAALDAGVLVGSGAVSAVSGAGSYDLCVGAGASVAVLYAVQLALCAAVRPFTTLFAFVHALMTLTLSATSVGLQVAGILEAKNGGNDAASLERQNRLAMAAAVCDLSVIGISAVRVLLDLKSCSNALRRIVEEIRSWKVPSRSSDEASGGPTRRSSLSSLANASAAHVHPPVLLKVTGDGENNGDEDDGDMLFWDSEGRALQPQRTASALLKRNAEEEGILLSLSQTVTGRVAGRDQQQSSDLALAFGSLRMMAPSHQDQQQQMF